jgi:PPM family protein phosphatase
MPVISAHKSDVGRKKPRNEDYVWVDEQAGLYILADGLGGQEAGEVASQLGTTTISKAIEDKLKVDPDLPAKTIEALVVEALETANATIFNAAQAAGHKRQMGTTAVVAVLQTSTAYISHAGDSRAYLVRGATLKQLTEDDSWGVFSASAQKSTVKNKRSPLDHFLTKYVGQENSLNPSFIEIALMPGDWLLLCSDGLWSMVDEEQILAELKKAGNEPGRLVEALVAAANQAGGEDNISIIALKMLPS